MKPATSALLFCFLLLSFACDDKNDDTNESAAKIIEVENRAINGEQWRITNYTRRGVSQTTSFNGYIFEFDTNRLMTVTNGSDNFSGTWSVTGQDSDDSKTEFDDIDFNLNFTNPPLFVELTEDWEIVSITDSKIELSHTSGSNSQTDLLTFEKI